jgi:hypothetical protein
MLHSGLAAIYSVRDDNDPETILRELRSVKSKFAISFKVKL